jgi:hypothetical protein
MGSLVGDSALFSTWGQFRTAIGNQTLGVNVYSHNLDFYSGFKSDQGNGLLRFDPQNRIVFIYQPIAAIGNYGGGDAFIFESSWNPGVITVEDQSQLFNQVVNATGGSFNITMDAFDNNLGQNVIGIATAPIIDIGYLTSV